MAHDFKQYVHTFHTLCEAGQYKALSEALNKLQSEQSASVFYIITGNPMIDAILSTKKMKAEQNNIKCLWKIDIPPSIAIKELDLCAILENTLDNSIEACLSVEENRFINEDHQ